MTPAANVGKPCGCRACAACADAAVARGAPWSDPFGTAQPVAPTGLIVKKLPPAALPGLFDEPTDTKGK